MKHVVMFSGGVSSWAAAKAVKAGDYVTYIEQRRVAALIEAVDAVIADDYGSLEIFDRMRAARSALDKD
jgi:hypothetical protein